MKDAVRKNKMLIDPPEERINHALGVPGESQDMEDRAPDPLATDHRFQPGDRCLVRRSCGRFTLAKVVYCLDGPCPHMEVQVDNQGSIKSIPMSKCAKYVRPLRSKDRREPSSPPRPRRLSREDGARSREILSTSATARSSGPERRSMIDTNLAIAQRRYSMKTFHRSKSTISDSFESCLSDAHLSPVKGRQASMDDVTQLDLNARSQRLCSRFRAGFRSSAPKDMRRVSQTLSEAEDHVRVSQTLSDMDDDVSDGDFSLIEKLDFDSEMIVKPNNHDEYETDSYSSDEEYLARSTPQDLMEYQTRSSTPDLVVSNNGHSVQRVPDLEFNEEYLLVALHSIGSV